MKALSFEEFAPSSYEDWKKLVLKELGEKPFDALTWNSEPGISMPAYFTESGKQVKIRFPASWEIFQQGHGMDNAQINKSVMQSLFGGCDAIGVEEKNVGDLKKILDQVHLEYISTHITSCTEPMQLLHELKATCTDLNMETRSLKGALWFDGLDKAGMKPGWEEIALYAKEHFTLFRVFMVDAVKIHQRGGSLIHELAYALSAGNEYMHQLREKGVNADEASAMLQFNFATGSSYFMQVAKYRAFRILWKTVVNAYSPKHDCSASCFIYAETSRFQQTFRDSYSNLLRATTQAMSAIAGGANCVNILPYNTLVKGEDDTSLRLARNIHHLLIEESYLGKMKDVAEGSYYIENLTRQLVNEAWKHFRSMQNLGGIFNTMDALDKEIDQHRSQLEDQLKEGRRVVVGVNKYQNKNEKNQLPVDPGNLTGFLEKE